MDTTVIVVTQPGLGTTGPGDAEFGTDMLDKFFHTLEKQRLKPKAICFYTEGVKLVTHGSPLETGLRLLHGLGVRLVVCQTCLQYYGIADQIAVGEVVGMDQIVRLMAEAERVITV